MAKFLLTTIQANLCCRFQESAPNSPELLSLKFLPSVPSHFMFTGPTWIKKIHNVLCKNRVITDPIATCIHIAEPPKQWLDWSWTACDSSIRVFLDESTSYRKRNQPWKLYPRNLIHPRINKCNEPRKFYPRNLIATTSKFVATAYHC